MTRRLATLLAALALAAPAATVQGVIYDDETQNPLARTKVTLAPLPGNPAPAVTLLSNDRGAYAFANVPPGWYLLRAMRTGYEVAEYGQARGGRPGIPFEVTTPLNPAETGELRQIVMHHQAVITGSVVDDNATGIAGWSVSVYTSRPPLRRVAETLTDDRGNFRVGELEAGAYIVRSGGGGLEDATTLVPSYYKFGTAVVSAEPVRVRLGETQGFVTIHTVEGQLYDLTGEVTAPDKQPVRVSLITDTGRRLIASAPGPFTATGVPPGAVEILAEGANCAGFQRLLVDRNLYVRIDCAPIAPLSVTGADGEKLLARRVDLDRIGPEQPLSPGEKLAPGRWEFTLRPAPTRYLTNIRQENEPTATPKRDEGWFVLDLGPAPRLEATFSDKPASLSGIVTAAGRPLTGAPVYLEQANPDAPEQPLETWLGRADERGHYEFRGLAPGTYRMVSGYDIDPELPEFRTRAASVLLREGDNISLGLEALGQ